METVRSMKNIFLEIAGIDPDEPVALATVVRAMGSTPQKPGFSALFGKSGLLAGTVGGGVSEGRVQAVAMSCAGTSESFLQVHDLANDITEAEEAICGGGLTILIDGNPLKSASAFRMLRDSILNSVPGVLISGVAPGEGENITLRRYWIAGNGTGSLPLSGYDSVKSAAMKLLAANDPAGFEEINVSPASGENETVFFLQPFYPPEKLIIAGAGHVGRALAHLGRLLEFEVTVIDERPEFASSSNIPDADRIVVSDIAGAVDELAVGGDTYVVIVTRGHKDDAMALRKCIGRNIPYIGMIGSKAKIGAVHRDFIEKGWATEAQWERVHTPVGLPIKSQTVQEIAVSIAAELVLTRNSISRQERE